MDADINAANAEAAAAIFAKDMGKRKMEEAKKLEEEQNKAQVRLCYSTTILLVLYCDIVCCGGDYKLNQLH